MPSCGITHSATHSEVFSCHQIQSTDFCMYRTAGLVNFDFTAQYVGVKHYSLLAPVFQMFLGKQTLNLVMLLHLRAKSRTSALGMAIICAKF